MHFCQGGNRHELRSDGQTWGAVCVGREVGSVVSLGQAGERHRFLWVGGLRRGCWESREGLCPGATGASLLGQSCHPPPAKASWLRSALGAH